jgi:hypothetical protein
MGVQSGGRRALLAVASLTSPASRRFAPSIGIGVKKCKPLPQSSLTLIMLQCPPPTERRGGEWKRGADVGNWTVVEKLDTRVLRRVDVSKSSQIKWFTQIGEKGVPRRVVITAISYHPANRDGHESSIAFLC